MADVPDIGKTPLSANGPRVNQPSSGTYGEKAANQQLEAQLPQMPPATPNSGPPTSPPISPDPVSTVPDMAGGAGAPPGVPAAIMQAGFPSGPAVAAPVNPMAGAATVSQGRLIVLQQLASSPDVSATTREWARSVMRVLVG